MTKIAFFLTMVGTLLVAALQATPAHANSLSYVAPQTGSDASDCSSLAQRCASLNKALTVTGSGGLIIILEDGVINNAAVTITQTVLIRGQSHDAQIFSAGPAITIDDSGSGAKVKLEHINISGGTTGAAISVLNVGQLQLTHVNESGYDTGLSFTPSSGTSSSIEMRDCDFRNNNTDNVLIAPTGSVQVNATLAHVYLHHANNIGLHVNGTGTSSRAQVVISDSVLSHYNTANISVTGGAVAFPGAGSAGVTMERTVINYSALNGIETHGAGAQVLLDNNMLAHSATGINMAGGKVLTLGNNVILATTKVSGGTLTSVVAK